MTQRTGSLPAFQEIVLRHSADAALLLHPQEGVVYASPACEHVTGIRAESFVGMRAADWVHPDDVDAAIARREAATVDGHAGPVLIRGRHGDGDFHWFEAEWWHLATDHTVLHLRNVHRQEVAITSTVRELAVLTAALEHQGTAVMQVQLDGPLQMLANGWRTLGWAEGAPPSRWSDLVHPEDHRTFAALMLGALPSAHCHLANGRIGGWDRWQLVAVDAHADQRVGAVLVYAGPA